MLPLLYMALSQVMTCVEMLSESRLLMCQLTLYCVLCAAMVKWQNAHNVSMASLICVVGFTNINLFSYIFVINVLIVVLVHKFNRYLWLFDSEIQ